VVNHTVYTSFGEIVSHTDAAHVIRSAYTGQVHDTETGLHYYNARYYDPAPGRFLSQDPMGFTAGGPPRRPVRCGGWSAWARSIRRTGRRQASRAAD
jgi:RHS repeat-associated protein